jgi:hypothetical protein
MNIVEKFLEAIVNFLLYPSRKIKYGILWVIYYRTTKYAEDILAHQRQIDGGIHPTNIFLQNMVVGMINDISIEFYGRWKNYSLLKKRVDAFYTFMETDDAKKNMGFRLIQVPRIEEKEDE